MTETLFQAVLTEFENKNVINGYNMLLSALSSNDQTPISFQNPSILRKMIQHISNQLLEISSSDIPSLKPPLHIHSDHLFNRHCHIFETLAWLFSSDYCYDPAIRQVYVSCQEEITPILEYLLSILMNNNSEGTIIGHVLFLLSAQTCGEIFSSSARSFIDIILKNFMNSSAVNLRKYAIRAIISLLRSCSSLSSEPALEFHPLNPIGEWLDDVSPFKDEYCELINLWPWKFSESIQSAAVRDAKKLMSKIKLSRRSTPFAHTLACSERLKEEVKIPFQVPVKEPYESHLKIELHLSSLMSITLQSARVWSSWFLLLPTNTIPSLLREESTSSNTAGYVLKPFETILDYSHYDGILCMESLVYSLCREQEWLHDQKKVLKLLLRVLSSMLDGQHLSSSKYLRSSTPLRDHVVSGICRCLKMLLACPWPNYDVTLRFQYSSNTTQLSSILEMVDFMVSSAEWIYQEDLTISNTLDISHLQTYSTQIQASLKIVLEGCMATSGLWDVLRAKEPLSQYSSLFNYRTALTGIGLPTVEQLSSIVELLNIILRQIHSLGRYYRQLSLYYCELCLLSGDNSQMCQVDEFKRIFFNLMNDVENVVKNHLQGWKFVVLVCGHTLLRQQIIPTTPSPQENESHFLLTYDSDGYAHHVLTSTDDTTATIIKSILQYSVRFWSQEGSSALFIRLSRDRELILDSVLWLLHRTSSFDLSLETSLVKDACQSVGGLYGCNTHMSPLAISVVWLLCLSHADMTDGCKNHLLLSNNEEEICQCPLIQRGIIRCMSGITESISLPSLLLWLPHMLNTTSSNPSNQTKAELNIFSLHLHRCGSTFGEAFTSLMFTLIGSATNFISSLATGSEGSSQARETMKISLRNLSITPLVMIQQLCKGLNHLSNSLTHERVRKVDDPKVSDMVVYGKVFAVWIELEQAQQSNISEIFGSSSLNGYYCRMEPDEIAHLSDYLILSFSFLQEAVRNLRSDSAISMYYLLSTTSFNLCLLWWCCVNSLALHLLDNYSDETLNLLRKLLSNTIVNPIMALFLFLKDASLSITCHITRSPDYLPPSSSTIDSSNSADQVNTSIMFDVIKGDIFSTWCSFILDSIIKLLFITKRIESKEKSLTPIVSDFVYCVLTHLSSLSIEKMLLVESFLSSMEEKSQRIAKFCHVLSTLSLVPILLHSKDHVVDAAVEQFVMEWNGKRKSSEYRCREYAPKKEKSLLLGEDVFNFSELQRDIYSKCSPRQNLIQEIDDSKEKSTTPTPQTPSTNYESKRIHQRASHRLSCSPYSPVIALRRGNDTSFGSQSKKSSNDQVSTLKATPPPQHKMFDEPIDLCTTVASNKRSFQETSDSSVNRLVDQIQGDSSPPLSPSPKRTRSDPEVLSPSPAPSPAPSMHFDSGSESPKVLSDSSQKYESEVIVVNQSGRINYSSEIEDSVKGYAPSQRTMLVSQNPSPLMYSRTLTSGCGRTEVFERNLETQTLSGRTLRFDEGRSAEGTMTGSDQKTQIHYDPKNPLETIATYLDHAHDAVTLASQNLPEKCNQNRLLLESADIQSSSEAEQLWSSQLDTTLLKCHELMGHLLSLRRTFRSSVSMSSLHPSHYGPPYSQYPPNQTSNPSHPPN